jgi:hypothetical protein
MSKSECLIQTTNSDLQQIALKKKGSNNNNNKTIAITVGIVLMMIPNKHTRFAFLPSSGKPKKHYVVFFHNTEIYR